MCVVFEHIETQRRKQIQDGWLDFSLKNILVLHSTQTDNQATLHVWKVAQVMQNHSLGDKWTCSHLSDVFAARLSVNSASSSALSSTVRCGARASAAAVSCGGAASRAPCVCVCVWGHGDVQYQHALWLGEDVWGGGGGRTAGTRQPRGALRPTCCLRQHNAVTFKWPNRDK